MKRTFLLLVVGIAVGAVVAKQNKPKAAADPVDLIIEKSNRTMRTASVVSAKADKQVASKVAEMKQTILVLEEEKEQLVEQVKVMQDEIIAVKAVAPAQPFDVLAIVPDSASRK